MPKIQITPDNAKVMFRWWEKELKARKWNFNYLGLSQTIPLQPIFKGSEFTILLARLAAMHLRTYKRNIE